jgi:hypothetical protein
MSWDGVLSVGAWLSQGLMVLSADDKRNAVIRQLNARTRDSVPSLQSFNDDQLIAKAAIYIFLLSARARTQDEMRSMSTDDLRNAIIVANENREHLGIPVLQSYDDQRLVLLALSWYNQ